MSFVDIRRDEDFQLFLEAFFVLNPNLLRSPCDRATRVQKRGDNQGYAICKVICYYLLFNPFPPNRAANTATFAPWLTNFTIYIVSLK